MASESERLLQLAQLQIEVGQAQRAAMGARLAQTPDALPRQQELVERIRACRAELRQLPEMARGMDEMAVNELAVLASLAGNAGRPEPEVDALLAEAMDVADENGDPMLAARAAVDHAGWRRERSDNAGALEQLYKARDRLDAVPTLPEQAQIDARAKVGTMLAETFRWLGDFGRAARELRKTRRYAADRAGSATAGLTQFFRQNDLLMLRFEAALLFMDSGRWRDAEAAFEAVEQKLAQNGAVGALAREVYRARIEAGRGQHAEALARLVAVAPAFLEHPWLAGRRGVFCRQRAESLAALGQPREALAEARRGTAFEAASAVADTSWSVHAQEARLARQVEGASSSLAAFDRALATIDVGRRASLGLRLDNLFLRRRRAVIDAAVLAAADAGDAHRCAAFADIAKSRFLAGALRAGPPPRPAQAQLDALDRLNGEIDAQPAGGSGAARAARIALLERIRLGRGELPPLRDDPLAIARQLAAHDKAALQLFVTDDGQIVSILLSRGEIVAEVRPLTPKARRALAVYAANLALPPEAQSPPEWDPALVGDAASLVPAALLERGLQAKALIVAPHGPLNILPWASLMFDRRRLFEWTAVAQVPSLAAIPALAARPPAVPRVSLFGNPAGARLTEAERQADLAAVIDTVVQVCGPRRIGGVATGDAAIVAAFRALADAAGDGGGMLHVACHGRFEAADPDSAGLAAADRVLTAGEIALHPLSAREVTLAACSTGVRPTHAAGIRLRGDDVVGLPSAFLEAGAATVLVSVTPAGDKAAAAFFRIYYTARLDGAPPLAAFNATQRTMLKDPSLKPRDWVGYTLYGVS